MALMMQHLAMIGLVLGLLSAIVLAFSLSPVVHILNIVAEWQSHSLDSIMARGDLIQITGVERELKKASRKANFRLFIGCGLLATSFAFQALSIYVRPAHTPPSTTAPVATP